MICTNSKMPTDKVMVPFLDGMKHGKQLSSINGKLLMSWGQSRTDISYGMALLH